MKKIECDHCRLEFDKDLLIEEKIDGVNRYFCCKGCQGVYHLLKCEGLDEFYDRVKDTKLEPANQKYDDLQSFDLEGFKSRYIKVDENGFNTISLIIEGIHCSACVWLNEKVLHKSDGIIEAEINFTTHKAKIVWDDEVIKLSQIIEKIRSIGYNAYPYDASMQEERAEKSRKDYYTRLLVGIFATMNVMWLSIAQYAGYFSGIKQEYKSILQFYELLLATPTLFFTGWIYFRGAYFGLRNRFINMDFLVATGASLTYFYSIYAFLTKSGETYFESTIMIITFVFVGKYLEVLSKRSAVDTIDQLKATMPTEVMVINDDKKSLISVENVKVGDIVELRSGDSVVLDGELISQNGSFDESSLSGESLPILKNRSDSITSGSINLDNLIRYRVTKLYNESTFSNIISLLEESLSKKPHIEKLANQISGYFSLSILLISIATFIVWFYFSGSFEKSLIIAISVIVIACPCALGLATPMATLIGVGEGAKRGILFKEAGYLESIAKCDTLVLDKTGTLTQAKPVVVNVKNEKEFDPNILYTMVKNSNHPISKGICIYLEDHYSLAEFEDYELEEIKARGLKIKIDNKRFFGGNIEFFKTKDISYDYDSLDENNSIFIFGDKDEIFAIFYLQDRIRDNAKEVIKKFQKENFDIIMLTGDREGVAKKVSKEIGIDKYKSSLTPTDKADFIDKLHQDSKRVIMVGDGVNDALALSKSDIAIAMGSGADVSINVSDVVLLKSSIDSLWIAYKLGKKTFINIKENLALSLLYNILTIPLAVMGYVIPLVAALSMSLSSLLVVFNAFRIKRSINE